jgi:CheY-like chemotaxis protein
VRTPAARAATGTAAGSIASGTPAPRAARKFLQFQEAYPTLAAMKQPLALLLYEKLLPGGQLVNRLQDLGYRVQPVPAPGDLVPTAEREKPLVAFVDLEPHYEKICQSIAALRENSATSHIPVIAFAAQQNGEAHESARRAGAKLVVNDTALLLHLSQFLDQALQVD